MMREEKYIVGLSLVVLIVASIFSQGYHHFDEHFQILEFAALKLHLTEPENLPWEYHEQVRSAIQPAIAVGMYKLTGMFKDDPFVVAFLLRLLSAFIALLSMVLLYKVWIKKIENPVLRKWFLILSFFTWFVVYNSVRFSSENWSAMFFIIAFACYFLAVKKHVIILLGIGCLLGFSFLFRFQSGFLVLGFILWMLLIGKEKLSSIMVILIGVLGLVSAGVLIDRWFYDEWVITAWNYLRVNIIDDRVSSFGVEPWWWYLKKTFELLIPPFSILYILSVGFMIFFRPKSVVTWCLISFLFFHFIIGHKEARFLFPIAGFLAIAVIEILAALDHRYPGMTDRRDVRIFIRSFFVVNFILLCVVALRPADGTISLYKTVYHKYQDSTRLYYIGDENPYNRVMDIHYYKRNNLFIEKSDTLEYVKADPGLKILIVLRKRNDDPEFKSRTKLIYTTFPEWIKLFNVNNWLGRAKGWYVYEYKE